jgi:ribosomal protein S6--L-glutamate ligase
MIRIVPKPTDTPGDNSTAMVIRELDRRGVAHSFINLCETNPFDGTLTGELIWVCGMKNDGSQFETLSALGLNNRVVNSPETIATCANKVQTSALLLKAGIPTPRTIFTGSRGQAERFVRDNNGAVYKPVYGYDGNGVRLVRPGDEPGEQPYYLQEYVENEEDFRVFVIGGEPVGAISRRSDSLTHNIHQGGAGRAISIPGEMGSVASKAARAVGADYCGVDLLRSGNSYTVLEVNGTPNWHCMSAPIPSLLADYLVGCLDETRA